MKKCIDCKSSEEELRPYGPKGAYICFGCMTSTPEREAEAKRQFSALLESAGRISVLTEEGPVPYNNDNLH